MNLSIPKAVKPKIILVDDHALFREGIRLLIEVEQIGEVIAEAENGKIFLEILEKHTPDMAILDIDMPVMNGLNAAKIAIEKFPDLKILILSMHGNNTYYSHFIDAGVKGFILKTTGKNELEQAIRKIIQGECYFSQELLLAIINDLKNQNLSEKTLQHVDLSDREKETLQLMCKGFTTREIADQLFLSPKTIEAYRSNLMLKTDTRNTLGLVLYAIKNKFITDF